MAFGAHMIEVAARGHVDRMLLGGLCKRAIPGQRGCSLHWFGPARPRCGTGGVDLLQDGVTQAGDAAIAGDFSGHRWPSRDRAGRPGTHRRADRRQRRSTAGDDRRKRQTTPSDIQRTSRHPAMMTRLRRERGTTEPALAASQVHRPVIAAARLGDASHRHRSGRRDWSRRGGRRRDRRHWRRHDRRAAGTGDIVATRRGVAASYTGLHREHQG